MVYRCVVFGCSNVPSENVSIFSCPENMRVSWSRFVKRTRAKWNSKQIYICSKHFTQDCFENWMAFESGFHSKLILKRKAVPTIYPLTQSACSSAMGYSGVGDMPDRAAFRKREVKRVSSYQVFFILTRFDRYKSYNDFANFVAVACM